MSGPPFGTGKWIALWWAAPIAFAISSIVAAAEPRAVAVLGPDEEPRFSEVVGGFTRGLHDYGYSQDVEIVERKVRRGDRAGARAAVEGLAARRPAAVFVIGSELARAAREVSADLPIVFITPGDPVAAGLVESLARPGGNMTAMTFEYPELSAKRLELLKAVSTGIRRILVVHDPRDASPRQSIAAAREAAPKLGMTLVEREARSTDDIVGALAALDETDAILAVPGGLTSAHFAEIIRVAHAKLRPTFFHARTEGTAEALATYGASDSDIARQAARLVGKILKGDKAGDLPIERPTKLKFILNLKTAKMLGLEIPATLLARADEVIE
jgi:putative ABC transport system substrate-binding protein